MAETVARLLDRAAAERGVGLRFLDRRGGVTWLDWRTVRARAEEACGRLQRFGVEPGARVALVHATGPEFFDAFFGVLLAGAVPVPLYPPVRLGRMDEYHRRTAAMIRAVDARLLLADARVRRLLGETIARLRPAPACRTLAELPAGRARPLAGAPDDLGLVQFSSGTTGEPRPVALSQRALLAQTEILESFLPRSADFAQAGVSWLPLYHDMGLIGCVFPALRRPGTLTLLGPETFVARPASWLRAISDWGASVSPAPNFAYALCLARIRDAELEGVDLSRWRIALNGAEPVAPAVLRAFHERFRRWGLREEALTPVYGLSEAALAVTFSDPRTPFRSARFARAALAEGRAEADPDGIELVSAGRPVPGFALRAVDDSGRALPENRVGTVHARGPSLMEGYLGMPEETARVLRDGWLDTGDRGFLRDGELFLCGRVQDVLVVRGRKYAPDAVEHAVDAVPGVRAGCAVAQTELAEGGRGEELLLFVEHRRGASAAQRGAIPAACSERVLAQTGLQPDRVLVLAPGTLPRTSSGKLRRAETLRRHRAGALTPPKRVTPVRVAGMLGRSALGFARARLRRSR